MPKCNRCEQYPCRCTGSVDVLAEHAARAKPLEVTVELLEAVSDAINTNQDRLDNNIVEHGDRTRVLRNRNLLRNLYAKLHELCENPS